VARSTSALIVGAALTFFAAAPLDAQSDSIVRQLSALRGGVTFAVPGAWHILEEAAADSESTYIYHIRSSRTDSASPDRANVLLSFFRRSAPADFRAASDSMFRSIGNRTMAVLNDTVPGSSQRAVFWQALQRSTPYAGFDNFAIVGDVWLHVRIVFPVIEGREPEWNERLSRDTEAMMRSIRVRGRKAFPAPIGFPVLRVFSE
jgi:hypothetical protein